jgi:hypothetical protein
MTASTLIMILYPYWLPTIPPETASLKGILVFVSVVPQCTTVAVKQLVDVTVLGLICVEFFSGFNVYLNFRSWFMLCFVYMSYLCWCRSQWPRGLNHEPSSPAQTLGVWVRIPFEAWMSVCVYSVFVLSCVGRGHATG